MRTASWTKYAGPGRIALGLHAPRWASDIWPYAPLFPLEGMERLGFVPFEARYRQILEDLDPARVWADLHALAGEYEPVLMGWAEAPFTPARFCHRRMAADWFGEALGFEVLEVGAARATILI